MKKPVKRILSLLLCLTILPLGLFAASTAAGAANVNKTQEEALAWLQSKLWTATNYDGAAGVQCVDLARMYSSWLGCDLGVCIYPTVETGCAYSYATQPINTNYYTRYNNQTDPKPGDIFVYAANSYGAYGAGHVGVITGVNSGGYYYIDYTGSYNKDRCEGHGSYRSYAYKSGLHSFTAIIRPHFKTSAYTLDVNVTLDGTAYNGGLDGVTFDVYVNNSRVADDAKDYCASHTAGASYRVDDIRVNGCLKYTGNTSYSGTLSANAAVTLPLETKHTPVTVPGKAATCTQPGLTDGKKCSACGATLKTQTVILPLGHDETETVIPATCVELQQIRRTCSRCGRTTTKTDPALFGEWTTKKPSKDAIETQTKTQYRSAQRENMWKQTESGEILYAQSWPGGFSKSNSLYTTYNKTPVKAAESETEKTEVTTEFAGYIYWHWCYGSYAYGPINRKISSEYSSTFPSFHAFFSTQDVAVTESANARQYANKAVCADTYWWCRERVAVYRCKYVKYQKVNTDGWAAWSAWQDDEITATDELKVEKRTLYRAIEPKDGLYAPHKWTYKTPVFTKDGTGDTLAASVCAVCGKTQTDKIPAWRTLPENAPVKEIMLGDVNFNGTIEAADARLALRAGVKLEPYQKGSRAFIAADVTRSGVIEAADARSILRAAVKLEDPAKW